MARLYRLSNLDAGRDVTYLLGRVTYNDRGPYLCLTAAELLLVSDSCSEYPGIGKYKSNLLPGDDLNGGRRHQDETDIARCCGAVHQVRGSRAIRIHQVCACKQSLHRVGGSRH